MQLQITPADIAAAIKEDSTVALKLENVALRRMVLELEAQLATQEIGKENGVPEYSGVEEIMEVVDLGSQP